MRCVMLVCMDTTTTTDTFSEDNVLPALCCGATHLLSGNHTSPPSPHSPMLTSRCCLTGISVSGTYVGCFQDTGCAPSSRLRAALSLNNPRITVKQCLDLALVAGWPYAGLAPGTVSGTTSCFGGDRLPQAPANPGCFAACSGNNTERCGDSRCQLSMYSGVW